jgi:hypothetical protein
MSCVGAEAKAEKNRCHTCGGVLCGSLWLPQLLQQPSSSLATCGEQQFGVAEYDREPNTPFGGMTVLFTNLYIFWLIAHISSPYPL